MHYSENNKYSIKVGLDVVQKLFSFYSLDVERRRGFLQSHRRRDQSYGVHRD